MSPLRFLGSLLVGKISSRRICGQAAGSARLRHLTDGVRGFFFSGRLPIGEKPHDTVAAAGALSAFLGGGIWYFKEDAHEPVARKLTDGENETDEVRREYRGGSVPTAEEFEMLKLRLRELGRGH